MDKEQIRKALDHFENDKFTDAKEILTKEIRDAKSEHLQKNLGLEEGYYGKGKKKKDMKEEEEPEDDKKKKKNGDDEDEDENGDD